MKEIDTFFEGVVKTEKSFKKDKFWKSIIYICCKEFGWNQEILFNTDIPFLLDLLDSHQDYIKREQEAMKKSRRRR